MIKIFPLFSPKKHALQATSKIGGYKITFNEKWWRGGGAKLIFSMEISCYGEKYDFQDYVYPVPCLSKDKK